MAVSRGHDGGSQGSSVSPAFHQHSGGLGRQQRDQGGGWPGAFLQGTPVLPTLAPVSSAQFRTVASVGVSSKRHQTWWPGQYSVARPQWFGSRWGQRRLSRVDRFEGGVNRCPIGAEAEGGQGGGKVYGRSRSKVPRALMERGTPDRGGGTHTSFVSKKGPRNT